MFEKNKSNPAVVKEDQYNSDRLNPRHQTWSKYCEADSYVLEKTWPPDINT